MKGGQWSTLNVCMWELEMKGGCQSLLQVLIMDLQLKRMWAIANMKEQEERRQCYWSRGMEERTDRSHTTARATAARIRAGRGGRAREDTPLASFLPSSLCTGASYWPNQGAARRRLEFRHLQTSATRSTEEVSECGQWIQRGTGRINSTGPMFCNMTAEIRLLINFPPMWTLEPHLCTMLSWTKWYRAYCVIGGVIRLELVQFKISF